MSSSSSSTSQTPPPPQHEQHVSILMPIQLTKDNYFLWKSFFIPILRSHDMLDLAEGREPCPPQFLSSTEDSKDGETENPAYTNWTRRDQTFLTWINATLSESLLRYALGYTSGLALWLDLETRLAENATSRVQELKHRLINLNKTWSTPVGVYIQSAKQITDGLEAAGFPVDDSEYVSCVLKGLPSAYDKFKASIKVDWPEPLTRETLHRLLQSYNTTCDNIDFTIVLLVLLGILASPFLTGFAVKLISHQ